MRKLSKISLLVALVLLTVGAVTYGPQLASATGDFGTRIDVLTRMLQIIQRNYVDDVGVDMLFDNAIHGVLENLDPHSRFISAEEYRAMQEQYRGDYAGIGISFDLFDGVITVLDALDGGPSKALGLRPGDQIIRINGEDATHTNYDEVYDKLRGPRGTQVQVTVQRPGLDEMLEYTITRGQVPIAAISLSTMIRPDVGYVRLGTFSQKAADQLEEALEELESEGMKRLIFDLRGNGGGLMVQALRITDKFLTGGKTIVTTRGRTPSSNSDSSSSDRGTHPTVPMIVLVNRGSASASEIVSGALQDWDRALIVGETTFGKALVQNQFQFKDGTALFLTIARYYTPSGRLIQRQYKGKDFADYYTADANENDLDKLEIEAHAPLEQLESPETQGLTPPPLSTEERPVYHTAGGRVVYGGGGIHPDIQIEPTRVSGLAAAFYRSPLRFYFRFAVDYAADYAAELPVDFEDYQEQFQVTDALMEKFVAFLRKPGLLATLETAGIPVDDEALKNAWEDMRVYLQADIAASIWGQERGREILIEHDQQVQQAVDLFPQAANLLSLEKKAS
ncbi:MAG: S41 family peptidase [Acidobacteriota bacterium]